jgi:hypothetical protein
MLAAPEVMVWLGLLVFVATLIVFCIPSDDDGGIGPRKR